MDKKQTYKPEKEQSTCMKNTLSISLQIILTDYKKDIQKTEILPKTIPLNKR